MADRISIAVAGLVREGRVLLGHRAPSRERFPDCWDLVGGHVEPGETPRQAVIRECWEELGVRKREPVPVSMVSSIPTIDKRAFLVTTWDGEPVNAAPEEHDELRWCLPGDLGDLAMADAANVPSIRRAVRHVSG